MSTPPPGSPFTDRLLSGRAVIVGLCGVTILCALTPFNNFVLNNTFLVGSLLPVGVILLATLFVCVINAGVGAVRPTWALARGELLVATSLTLVGAALPSAGLMRYLPGHLVGIFNEASVNRRTAELIDASKPADWVFPRFDTESAADRAGEPVVRHFIARALADDIATHGYLGAVPWRRWLLPAAAWLAFAAALYGAMLSLVVIVRRQWMENERLPFPLAEVYASLLPEPGSDPDAAPRRSVALLPAIVRSRSFWLAAGAVYGIHMLNGAGEIWQQVPRIPLRYDISGLLANGPLAATTYGLKAATVMFTVIGICYFVQSRVAFSLVFFFFIANVVQVTASSVADGVTLAMQRDQTVGAIAVFAATFIYTGRKHWLNVARCLIGRPLEGEAEGDAFASYRLAGWTLLTCVTAAAAWLTAAGSPPLNALLIVLGVLTMWMVVARVAAESGLIYVQLHMPLHRPWVLAGVGMPEALATGTTPRGYFLLNLVGSLFAHDLRENATVYAGSGVALASRHPTRGRDGRRWLAAWMFVALILGFCVAGASMLVCEYGFADTLDQTRRSPLNAYGVSAAVQAQVLEPTAAFLSPMGGPNEQHRHWLHVAIGGSATAAVSVGYLKYAAFPLHPIGAVMCWVYSLQNTWFSIFLGWLAKVLVVRFGGAELYRAARNVFIGLVLGEAFAIGSWLVINLILAANGVEYRAINILI